MKKSYAIFLAGLSLLAFNCATGSKTTETNNSTLKITVNKQADVEAVPSASGLEWYEGNLCVVSDDSPWLFDLDENWTLKEKLTLREYEMENGRVPKKVKPDYEALTTDGDTIVVLSSGSKSPSRDFGYIINAETKEFTEVVLTEFYVSLKSLAGIADDKEINIEAVAATDSDMFIFHRGNNSQNVVFKMAKGDFYSYVKKEVKELPAIEVLQFTLPSIEGFVSGFSGASYIPEQEAFLVTSSVEATGDAYNDGEVLGSFIGYLPLSDFMKGGDLRSVLQPLAIDGETIITKVESISVKEIDSNGNLIVTAASDNDTGVSEFFNLTLEI